MGDIEDVKPIITRVLEVCIDSLDSAVAAVQGGANRLEVCSSLDEGGLTPSLALVDCIKETFPDIPMFVMLRCNSNDLFYVSENDLKVILKDLAIFKEHNVDGFVFGALNMKGLIDEEVCRQVVELADPLPVTFHRAFDVSAGLYKLEVSINKILSLGFKRILTSGLSKSLMEKDAVNHLSVIVKKANDSIVITAGGGVSINNIYAVMGTRVKEIHGSFRVNTEFESWRPRFNVSGREKTEVKVTNAFTVGLIVKAINNPRTVL